MKNYFSTLLITGLLLGAAILPSKAFADCSIVYGGGESCPPSYSFNIVKTVQVPGKGGGNYINSLSINDPKYAPGQTVNFKITVTNTGNQNIPTITVVDTFPQYLSFVSGPGSYNANNKTLTFTISNLGAGQSTGVFNITGRISDSNLLPSDQGIVCMINQANGTDNNGVTHASSSQFCVEKGVLSITAPVKIVATPSTGPEMLPLLALLPGGLGGFILRKKSKNLTK